MKKREPSYDPACYDLAAAFLSEEPNLDREDRRKELATDIQQCIESYIRFLTVET